MAMKKANAVSEAKKIFLAHMSHEIRTLMNAIIGMITLAINSIDKKDKTIQYLDKITVSSKILLNIINDILNMSAIENNKIKISSWM